MNQFRLVQAVDRFIQRVVVAAYRRLDACSGQLSPLHPFPDLVLAIAPHIGLPDTLALRKQKLIAFRAGTAPRRIAKRHDTTPVARQGNPQYVTNRLGSEGGAMWAVYPGAPPRARVNGSMFAPQQMDDLFLLIAGPRKLHVLNAAATALQKNAISTLANDNGVRLDVYWCKK